MTITPTELGLMLAAFIICMAVLLWANWPRQPCRKWCGREDCTEWCRRRG